MIAAAALALLCLAGPGPVLTLDDALARAASHPRVAAARGAAAQAAARVGEARAGYLPSASAAATYVPGQASDGGGSAKPSYQAGVAVAQPLWDFGRTRGQVRAARLGEDAAASDVAAAAADVELQLRSAYYAALAAEELVLVAEDAERQMRSHLALAQASLEVGRRTPFDVARAEVDVASARIARIQAESGLATARSALAAAMGEDLGGARLARPAEAPARDPGPEEAVATALADRAELLALEARLAAQGAAVSAASAAYYPILSAAGQLDWKGAEVGPAARTWQVSLVVTLPLLAGGGDAARVREQEAALAQLRSQRELLALQIRAEAEQAALTVDEARAREAAAENLLSLAKDSLALAEGRYEAGVGSIIELSDAQGALTGARSQRVRAEYDLATARARLDRAVGAPRRPAG